MTETIDGYLLVAGERRLRAARAAGLERIPAVVRQLDEQARLEVALVENLQREDLDPIEAARGFRRLIDEFGFTPERIATRVGRARSTVANTLRLLDLAPGVQRPSPRDGSPRATAGRSAASASTTRTTSSRPSRHQDLSVRQTEELVRRLREPKTDPIGARCDRPHQRPGSRARRGGPPPGARHQGAASPARGAAVGSSSSTTATKNWGVSTSA